MYFMQITQIYTVLDEYIDGTEAAFIWVRTNTDLDQVSVYAEWELQTKPVLCICMIQGQNRMRV
jgi:hypothetical protein